MDDQADMLLSTADAPPGGDQVTCTWCQKPATTSLMLKSIDDGAETCAFCSEVCFTQCRRASFKRNKICNWCRHVRHTLSYVDFQDGDQQLQFCSNKCLNQYKMNIFCRETQAHLAAMDTGTVAAVLSNKQILITPELWSDTGADTRDSPAAEGAVEGAVEGGVEGEVEGAVEGAVDLEVKTVAAAVVVKVEPDIAEKQSIGRRTQEQSTGKRSPHVQSFSSSCDTLRSPQTSPSPSHCLSPPSSCNSCSDGSVFNAAYQPLGSESPGCDSSDERSSVNAPLYEQMAPLISPQQIGRGVVSPGNSHSIGHPSGASKHHTLDLSSVGARVHKNSPFGEPLGQRQPLPPPLLAVPMSHPIPPMPLFPPHHPASLGHHAAASMFAPPGPFLQANNMPMPPFPNPFLPPNTLMVPYPVPIPFPVPIPIPIPIPIREDIMRSSTEMGIKTMKEEERNTLPDSCEGSTSSTSHDQPCDPKSPSLVKCEQPRENMSPESGESLSVKEANSITCACCQSLSGEGDVNTSAVSLETDATCLTMSHRSRCLGLERSVLCSLANNNEAMDLSKEKTLTNGPGSSMQHSSAKKPKLEEALKISVPRPTDLSTPIPAISLLVAQPNTTPYSSRRSRILDAPRVPKETSLPLTRSSYVGLSSTTTAARDLLYRKRRCIRPHIKSK